MMSTDQWIGVVIGVFWLGGIGGYFLACLMGAAKHVKVWCENCRGRAQLLDFDGGYVGCPICGGRGWTE